MHQNAPKCVLSVTTLQQQIEAVNDQIDIAEDLGFRQRNGL
jgi:hypothetical protein